VEDHAQGGLATFDDRLAALVRVLDGIEHSPVRHVEDDILERDATLLPQLIVLLVAPAVSFMTLEYHDVRASATAAAMRSLRAWSRAWLTVRFP
jgi:hypothetical protein